MCSIKEKDKGERGVERGRGKRERESVWASEQKKKKGDSGRVKEGEDGMEKRETG